MPKHTFQINAPEAKKVYVAGDFNGWKTEDIRLKKKRGGNGGLFSASVDLEPGSHEFKFLIDGNWVCDSESQRVPNPFGTENSVCNIPPKPETRGKET